MDEYLVAHPELAAQMEASRRRAEKEAAELAEIRKHYVDTLEYNSPSNK